MSINLIRNIEERSLNAWPALRTSIHDGWILRMTPGYPSKRANSVTALYPLDQDVDCLAHFEQDIDPCTIRQTPLTPSSIVDRCLHKGYRSSDPQLVMICTLKDDLEGSRHSHPHPVLHSRVSTKEWLDGFAMASDSSLAVSQAQAQMLGNITHPAAFVSIGDTNPVAFGYGVVERGMIGLFDILTDPAHRKKGLARSIVLELLDWGREKGATQAYLQVGVANAPALRLYRALGFEEVYRYSYLVKPDDMHGRGI